MAQRVSLHFLLFLHQITPLITGYSICTTSFGEKTCHQRLKGIKQFQVTNVRFYQSDNSEHGAVAFSYGLTKSFSISL